MKIKKALLVFFLLNSCSDIDRSENEKIKKCNEKKEKIYRLSNESYFSSVVLPFHEKEKYPWENFEKSQLPKITKEFFACKGSEIHPPIRLDGFNDEISDCAGFEKHSLPMTDNKEYISATLIHLLNYLQHRCLRQVVITTGHRCLAHEIYSTGGALNKESKHLTGEEVDFYIEGYEDKPLEIVRMIMDYYQNNQALSYNRFIKCQKNKENLEYPGWYNKEIIIRVHEKNEGRDFDNRHPYPYITIQIR
jgi:hypothetical protein